MSASAQQFPNFYWACHLPWKIGCMIGFLWECASSAIMGKMRHFLETPHLIPKFLAAKVDQPADIPLRLKNENQKLWWLPGCLFVVFPFPIHWSLQSNLFPYLRPAAADVQQMPLCRVLSTSLSITEKYFLLGNARTVQNLHQICWLLFAISLNAFDAIRCQNGEKWNF